MKLEFTRQVFQKSTNIKVDEHSSLIDKLFHADGQSGGKTLQIRLTIPFRINLRGV
jgi:hypothetical protein